LKTILSYV
jgi:hypothetical protein